MVVYAARRQVATGSTVACGDGKWSSGVVACRGYMYWMGWMMGYVQLRNPEDGMGMDWMFHATNRGVHYLFPKPL